MSRPVAIGSTVWKRTFHLAGSLHHTIPETALFDSGIDAQTSQQFLGSRTPAQSAFREPELIRDVAGFPSSIRD
jgi:hypothetical protein